MRIDDLPLVARWLSAPHVARWYLAGSSVEEEVEDLRRSVAGEEPMQALIVADQETPIGWCQWYPCDIDAQWAAELGAGAGDVGIDYALGEAARVGRGVGTALIAALVERVRAQHPRCAVMADPDARNVASRRVLEKNGFELVEIKSMLTEPTDDAMAIYRLAASSPSGA
ncbi:MAG TPA: GNAT family N-acetyltransferase [Acidimicrobiales bacterium]|nr:GNAT family N-acetyltransferase [Acidimicrobiales bacterium]